MVIGTDGKKRCFGGQRGKEFYGVYHDTEWAVPVHDDRLLFEMLILEGAQAGLSWETILKRRSGYQRAFCNFDPARVAQMTDEQLEALRSDEGIIRNRLKIYATRRNAQVFLEIQRQFGSFDVYLWKWVDGKQLVSKKHTMSELPTKTAVSDAISRDLKKRGMTFVGSTIMYAYMQAVGMVNDHLITCSYWDAQSDF